MSESETLGTEITKGEFCDRFVAHMVACARRNFEKTPWEREEPIEEYLEEVEAYARQSAGACWDDPGQRGDSDPEECAESDMDHWGEA